MLFTLSKATNPLIPRIFSRLAIPVSFKPNSPRRFFAKDYYQVLGLDKSASDADLKKSYFNLVKKYHPDHNKSATAKQKFQEVSEAYDTLKDPQKRRHYDAFGTAPDDGDQPSGAADGSGPFGFGGQPFGTDPFAEAFGGGDSEGGRGFFESLFNAGAERGPRRGKDITMTLSLDFMEAVNGCTRDVALRREGACAPCGSSGAAAGAQAESCAACGGQGVVTQRQGPMLFQTTCARCGGEGRRVRPCAACGGQGSAPEAKTIRVVVPRGVDQGTKVRVRGQGHAGRRGGEAGSLVLEMSVAPDARFRRSGSDVHATAEVAFEDALLGASVRVPTLDGEAVVKVREGTQPGDTVRMAGKGVHVLNRSRRGDQYVHFKVVLPKYF